MIYYCKKTGCIEKEEAGGYCIKHYKKKTVLCTNNIKDGCLNAALKPYSTHKNFCYQCWLSFMVEQEEKEFANGTYHIPTKMPEHTPVLIRFFGNNALKIKRVVVPYINYFKFRMPHKPKKVKQLTEFEILRDQALESLEREDAQLVSL